MRHISISILFLIHSHKGPFTASTHSLLIAPRFQSINSGVFISDFSFQPSQLKSSLIPYPKIFERMMEARMPTTFSLISLILLSMVTLIECIFFYNVWLPDGRLRYAEAQRFETTENTKSILLQLIEWKECVKNEKGSSERLATDILFSATGVSGIYRSEPSNAHLSAVEKHVHYIQFFLIDNKGNRAFPNLLSVPTDERVKTLL